MKIRLLSLMDGARQATGSVVIIDVYRAFTTAAVAFQAGAARLILVDTPQKALNLRKNGLCDLCFGEVGGIKVSGFDFGNSPYELSRASVNGKTLAQSTSAGTKGVMAARANRTIYVSALVNATATARAILAAEPDEVSLVAMGTGGINRSEEDELCALYLRNLLRGQPSDPSAIRAMLLSSCDSYKFEDPTQPHFDPRDRDIALNVDSNPLVITIQKDEHLMIATSHKID
jgi:2-phosphosulfolactate phosphatase